ncbi:hypothetical protein HYT02_00575 [Candidatus Gottesmanbacteria bacterium]|nr:hypothetical protein [Candidatus Gottesmanbacteria bacterium]
MWKEVKTLFNPHSIYSNLFNLSRMREIGLKKSIEIASGQICALIHPFYEPRPGSDDDKIVSNEALRKWQEQRFMQIILTSPSTVFIFEEAGKIVNTASVLHQSDNKTPVCFIPTEPSSPLPRIPPYIMQDSKIYFLHFEPTQVALQLQKKG